jgi:type II secretory pathway component PulJ
MHDSETRTEKIERFYRLLDRMISHAATCHNPQALRRQLEVAIMISPLTGADQAAALGRFDAVVELVEQLETSLRARI